LVITDQQRYARHWPGDPGWLAELMPNERELARTGLTFTNAFCNSAMCSPSRATLLTGRYPAEHGVELTLTAADLHPDPRNTPAVATTMARILRRSEAPARRVLTQFARGALRMGPRAGHEAILPTDLANLATLLREAEYEVAYKGKWHLTHPSGGDDGLLGGWTQRDAAGIQRDYGFADWEAPDAGENARGPALRGATPDTERAGTRSTHNRPSAGSAVPTSRSRSALSSPSSTPTTCSAIPPRTCAAATRRRNSATSASSSRPQHGRT